MTQRFYSLITTVRRISIFFVAKNFLVSIMLGLLASSAALAAETSQSWEQILAAAKKEGTVAVIAPQGNETREALTQEFQKKYGISVELLGTTGRELVPRVSSERKAGQFLWDVYIHGTTTALEALIPLGAFDPLEPALILPDVKNPKTWRGGVMEFLDPNKTVMVMTPFQRGTIFYNPKFFNGKDFKSYKDLLDPKFKGKIAVDDPRKSGPGQATFTFFYLHPELGPDFIRALGKQQLVFFRDYAQEADAIGQGRSLVLLGTADFFAIERARLGVPISIVEPKQIKEGTDVSPANGNVALFNRAPHPNAAKVYINWLLSKEGQAIFARAVGYPSARLDVPNDNVPAWRIPQPNAIKTYTKAAMDAKDDVLPLLREVLGK